MKQFLTTTGAVILGLIVYNALLKKGTTADNFSMPFKGGTPRKQTDSPYGHKGETITTKRHK